ncbi:vascular endothelial growth factor A-A-like isoform X1 [Oncorhynchus masou masou]|uniref:vascular endothelial growth factor A-A-like isoform X1 n=1 Tax=Oncorhynchus masou masou TaxID=90313 RepID=UPI0031839B5F
MNFDSLITLFLLALLYLSAVKSAHIPKEGGRSAHDGVISFMEVYNKSLCQPRELLVEILQEYPEEVEHIFIPSCVVLTRCAGCCNDEMLQCTPTSTHNVTMEIKRIKPHKQQNDIFMSFTEHNACECRPKNEVKEQKENQCEPCCDGCLARRKRLFIQNPLTCQCSCRNSDSDCRARQLELNERTCRCDKPRR